ncbi:MAG: potassium-transporting ATPase subunit KdpA [Alphaproteobacteria bacterium]|nr:potassium-transporting ATPase subunit KdpA [Alphaproteobacteria bacterium]
MFAQVLAQLALLAIAVAAVALPLSFLLAAQFDKGNVPVAKGFWSSLFGPAFGTEQNWKSYLLSALVFNLTGAGLLFLILLFQDHLPFNPLHADGLSPAQAFNIAISFMTNTDWQAYTGDETLSLLSRMAGLGAQNFLSAATGIALAFAVVRGFVREKNPSLGNFYRDAGRAVIFILLPLSVVAALFLVHEGVPQTLAASVQASAIDGGIQTIVTGPVASQVAIKVIGSNGGGYFTANGAHPFENPTPLSNFVQMVLIFALPAAFLLAFGRMVKDRRQSRSLLAASVVMFAILFVPCAHYESKANPALSGLAIDQQVSEANPGGNMEGKETRFGILGSTLWATATTATSNGATNAALDSYMPLGGLIPLFNMLLGEVVFGGVGCGLIAILVYTVLTVFIAGLLAGRTPEYLGKKIEAREITLAVVAVLLHPLCVLIPSLASLAAMPPGGEPHSLTQTLYAYASASANNGSSFASFDANTVYQNIALGLVMLAGRFGYAAPVLAIAGSLSSKRAILPSGGTFPTHGTVFVILLIGVIFLLGGLTFLPAVALGPIAEHLSLYSR